MMHNQSAHIQEKKRDVMSETMYDMTRSMKNSMRSNTTATWVQTAMVAGQARYQRKQVQLAEIAAQMQSESLSLQEEANAQAKQQTMKLKEIGISASAIASDTKEVARQSYLQNEALKNLTRISNESNRLKEKEIGAINELIDHVDQRTFEIRLGQRRQWLDGTGPGMYYHAWERVAQDTIERSLNYTRRMEKAREKDLQDRYKKHLADLGISKPSKESFPVEPTMETLDEVPNVPDVPQTPKRAPETYPWDVRNTLLALLLSLIICAVAGYKFFNFLKFHIFENISLIAFSPILSGISLIASLLCSLLTCIVAWLLFDALLGMLSTARHPDIKKRIQRQCDEQFDKQMEEWNNKTAQIKEIEQEAEHVKNENSAKQNRYIEAKKNWKAECDRIEREYVLAKQDAQKRNEWNRRQSIKKAYDDVMPPTRWATINPMPIVRANAEFIKKSYSAMGIDNVDDLPDPRIPAFAEPNSLPGTAPHMRAELCKIIAEYAKEQMDETEKSELSSLMSADYKPLPGKPLSAAHQAQSAHQRKDKQSMVRGDDSPLSAKTITSSPGIPDGTYVLTRRIQRENNRQIRCIALVKNGCFHLQKGSTIAETEAQSAGSGCSDDVLRLRHDANVVGNGLLLREVEFSSPTSAGSFVIGGYCKGWNVWKTLDGTPLSELRN